MADNRKFCGSISVRIGTRRVASAVATQEVTDDDSNGLRKQPVNETAVAIRKARRLANDWRKLELSPAPLHGGPEGFYRVRASAVATQEATDDDSSKLHGKTVNETAVAIRKPERPANGYRQARRWVDAPDGGPRFLDAAGITRLAAETALCGVEQPAPAPFLPYPSRVTVRRWKEDMPDYYGTWTCTPPILDYGGVWRVAVIDPHGKRIFVSCADVTVHEGGRRGH